MAAPIDELLFEFWNAREDFPMQTHFASVSDEFGHIVGIKAVLGCASGMVQRFFEDPRIGLPYAHFKGEDFMIKEL